jgi:pyrroline-5-carboxylate reductase
MSTLQESAAAANGSADSLNQVSLSFIGCGAMAEAMIAGLLRQGLVRADQIAGSHPRQVRRDEMEARYRIRLFEDNRAAAEWSGANHGAGTHFVILAIKPQRLPGVLQELKGMALSGGVVVSIIAGATIASIAHEIGHGSVVRAMPNTPAQIGQGITAWTADGITDVQHQEISALLGALGREMHVETERMIDMATALSATGPTYAFLVMEALTDAGVHLGFSRHLAQELVQQTILGSVLFAIESGKHPAELRNMVTSPGGTSAEAIYQMEKGGLRTVLSKAVYAAFQKAEALGKKQKV